MLANMTSPLRNIVAGAVVATAMALMFIPNLGGISTWKYVLAAIGLVLWFLAEKRR